MSLGYNLVSPTTRPGGLIVVKGIGSSISTFISEFDRKNQLFGFIKSKKASAFVHFIPASTDQIGMSLSKEHSKKLREALFPETANHFTIRSSKDLSPELIFNILDGNIKSSIMQKDTFSNKPDTKRNESPRKENEIVSNEKSTNPQGIPVPSLNTPAVSQNGKNMNELKETDKLVYVSNPSPNENLDVEYDKNTLVSKAKPINGNIDMIISQKKNALPSKKDTELIQNKMEPSTEKSTLSSDPSHRSPGYRTEPLIHLPSDSPKNIAIKGQQIRPPPRTSSAFTAKDFQYNPFKTPALAQHHSSRMSKRLNFQVGPQSALPLQSYQTPQKSADPNIVTAQPANSQLPLKAEIARNKTTSVGNEELYETQNVDDSQFDMMLIESGLDELLNLKNPSPSLSNKILKRNASPSMETVLQNETPSAKMKKTNLSIKDRRRLFGEKLMPELHDLKIPIINSTSREPNMKSAGINQPGSSSNSATPHIASKNSDENLSPYKASKRIENSMDVDSTPQDQLFSARANNSDSKLRFQFAKNKATNTYDCEFWAWYNAPGESLEEKWIKIKYGRLSIYNDVDEVEPKCEIPLPKLGLFIDNVIQRNGRKGVSLSIGEGVHNFFSIDRNLDMKSLILQSQLK